ncbi:MAG: MBOAT family protein [Deltaproteobacteria bacterium]|nr:MBOAT family protein [Deltaproteobacteria bacterium]
MVFSSFLFLFLFLPVFMGCYYLAPVRWRNLVALLGSYLFYAWGAPRIVGLFIVSCLIDYLLGVAIARLVASPSRKKFLLLCSLTMNLGALAYYKYSNFFVGEFNRLLELMGFEGVAWTNVALPIGISFFTFQKISYIVDVYRGKVEPAQNFVSYALYIALFPQLIAGPIICYPDIHEQLHHRRYDLQTFFDGVCRFCMGLGKKVLIADAMGSSANMFFKLGPDQLSTPYAWLGIICYAYQIYFDFSGYSDMAIGLGKMMGFDFLENFNRPYISQNVTEFWRRWHISLSHFMRDYLYIPLGGNRVSPARLYFNLCTVFLLSGLWHGAAWTFVFWGLYHGTFLVIDRLFWLQSSKRLGRFVNTLLTFVVVLFGWVFFRSETISEAFNHILRMVDFYHYWSVPRYVPRGMVMHNQAMFVFVLATLICFAPTLPRFQDFTQALSERFSGVQMACLRFAGGVACLVLTALTLSSTNYTPFIYFRF